MCQQNDGIASNEPALIYMNQTIDAHTEMRDG